ncbi:MAG: carbon storage regulator [Planctomycetota bacterium]
MLVLSRKASERIKIGENITVEVRRVAGNRVTLAIEAPRDIRILRGELEKVATEFEEPAATNQPEAAQQTSADDAGLTDTYVVSHKRVPLPAKAIPQSDLSDHGMQAYAI